MAIGRLCARVPVFARVRVQTVRAVCVCVLVCLCVFDRLGSVRFGAQKTHEPSWRPQSIS